MEFNIEKRIQLNVNPDNSLYSWSLQEIDETGESGEELIPWGNTLYFESTELQYIYKLGTGSFGDEEFEKSHIQGKLRSGWIDLEGEIDDVVSYNMYGNDTNMFYFDMIIRKLDDDGSDEYCYVDGIPSYTSELDFIEKTTEDVVIFNIFLKSHQYNNIVRLILNNQLVRLSLSVNRVSGFYSGWSPSISTYRIKVLTGVHSVEGSEESDVDVMKVGEVGNFNLSVRKSWSYETDSPRILKMIEEGEAELEGLTSCPDESEEHRKDMFIRMAGIARQLEFMKTSLQIVTFLLTVLVLTTIFQ